MKRMVMAAVIAGFLCVGGTILLWPVPAGALIFEEFAAFLRGGVAPPDGAWSVGCQEFLVNGAKLRMSFYRTGGAPEKVQRYYHDEAGKRGWREREDLDLLGALTGATGRQRQDLEGRVVMQAFQKGERIMLLGILARRAEETWFAAVEADRSVLAVSKADPLDPLVFLERAGAQRRCFVKQQAGREGVILAALYRCSGDAARWAERTRQGLQAAGWGCSGGPVKDGGYVLDAMKDRAHALVTLSPEKNGGVIVSVWGIQRK